MNRLGLTLMAGQRGADGRGARSGRWRLDISRSAARGNHTAPEQQRAQRT